MGRGFIGFRVGIPGALSVAMDDLEKAILISFDESGTVDPGLKSQAVAFCQQAKDHPTICSLCVERLRFSKLVQVQFWCLQSLHEGIRVRYSSLSTDERSFIRTSVFSMACFEGRDDNNCVRVLNSPAFIRNKLAQVFVTLIYFEYPLVWPSVFTDLLAQLSMGAPVIDMFCRVLNSLDDELISLDYPRTTEEIAIAARVKDAMRQQCVSQIVRVWYDIVSMYRNSDPELCATVLDTMRRYISWIDIGLIANDVFMPLLFDLILVDGFPEQLRGAAAGCVLAVVYKRMDYQAKLSLLQSLQIRRVFGLVGVDNDSELVSRIAALLTGYAAEVLECSKRINSEISTELLNEVLPSVFYVMRNCELDTTFSTVQFLSDYVATLKSCCPLGEKQLMLVGQILEVIRGQILYDPFYRNNLDVLDKIGKEEEDRMSELRKDLFVLLRNVGRVAPDVTQIFIRNLFARAITSNLDSNVEEVEAALSLFYALGESVSDEAIKSGSGLLKELVPMLLSTRFTCHSNRLVALVYLETITRYMKFAQENTQYIPMILGAFLDERGIHNPNVNVSRRASYLFMRVVKFLKAKLVPFIETILQSLQDTVARFTRMNYTEKQLSASEDGSHIFEAIGLLIGMEEVSLEKQSEYLSSVLPPLCHQVEALLINAKVQNPEESLAAIANIQLIIMAINALSKGFSERLVTTSRPAIGLMFKQTLDVLPQILVAFPKTEPLRSKVTSYIHRMVDTLGPSVFPYLPRALEQLLAEIEPKELVAFLVLINQLICKFSAMFRDILQEIFPAVVSKILNILPGEVVPSGPGSNTEEIRELQDLQKTFYIFLHVMTTHDLSSVLLSPGCSCYLHLVMQLLLNTACNHNDTFVRKACIQIFIRLIKDWCSGPHGEEQVHGFQSFIVDSFATKCCLHSVLDRSFEFHDANTHILFGEIVLAQKVMYEKLGDNFLNHFMSKFRNANCPQDMVERYHQKLKVSDQKDLKALKSCYQILIENLRVQQNGSLVFR